jgi:hypothetical protein
VSGSGEYVLAVSDKPIGGDFDADTDVDGGDLATLLLHFGITSGALASDGDADIDGDVDRDDLEVWRQNAGLGALKLAPPPQVISSAGDESAQPVEQEVLENDADDSPEPWLAAVDLAFGARIQPPLGLSGWDAV